MRNVAGEGRQLRSRDGLGHCEQLVRPYILAFIHRVLVPLNFKNRCVNWVFTGRSVVRNNPPRKAVSENLGILNHLVFL